MDSLSWDSGVYQGPREALRGWVLLRGVGLGGGALVDQGGKDDADYGTDGADSLLHS
jgi:hypothetical protein